MADKPVIDPGWFLYSHVLDAVISASGFSKVACMILREVRSQLYGPANRELAELCANDLARRFGVPRQAVNRAMRELIEAGTLAPRPGGRFKFIKKYHGWTRPPVASAGVRLSKDERASGRLPRFTDAELDWIGEATRRAVQQRQEEQDRGTWRGAPKAAKPSIDKQKTGNHSVSLDGNHSVSGGNHSVSEKETILFPPSPISETSETRESARPLENSQEPFEPPPPDLPPEITGPGPDSPEGKALIEWARTLGADQRGGSYAEWAAGVVTYAPAEWIRSLLNKKVATTGKRISVMLLGTILAQWREARQPEWPIATPTHGSPTSLNGTAPKGLTPEEEAKIVAWHATLKRSTPKRGQP